MAVLIDMHDARIAFGLVWKEVSAKRERREAAAFVHRHKAAYKIRWGHGGAVCYGVAPAGKAAPELRGKTPVLSAVALFATKVPATVNALFIFPADLKHGKYALLAVIGGLPYLDALVAPNYVRERVESLKEEGHGDFAEYGQHPDFPHAVDWTLNDLLAGARPAATMAKGSARLPLSWKPLLMAAAIAVAGGVSAWDYVERQERLREEQQAPQLDPVQEYKTALRNALGGAAFSGADALTAFWAPLAPRPTTQSGWSVRRAKCTRQSCVEEWARSGGTNADLAAALPAGARYAVNGGKEGDMVALTRPLTVRGAALLPATLPAKEAFWLALTSRAQRWNYSADFIGDYGLRYTLAPAQLFAAPATVDVRAVPKYLAVERGSYSIAGPLGLLKETLSSMESNMTVDELAIDIADGAQAAKFSVKGVYYVKN